MSNHLPAAHLRQFTWSNVWGDQWSTDHGHRHEATVAVLPTGLAGFASEVRALAVSRTAFPAPRIPLSVYFPEAAPERMADDEARSLIGHAAAFEAALSLEPAPHALAVRVTRRDNA
ncbi:MAG: hypothetical protein OXG47_07420 [bacterium]|nr:hypothetical protein [bacterium]